MVEHADGQAPHHPEIRFEPTDVDDRGVYWFIVILVVSLVVFSVGLWGLVWWFNHDQARAKKSRYPLLTEERQRWREQNDNAVTQPFLDQKRDRWRTTPEPRGEDADRSRLARLPRLEGIDIERPEHTIGRLYDSTAREQYQREEERLGNKGPLKGYGWVRPPRWYRRGVAHIPVEEALAQLVKMGNKGPLKGRPGPAPEDEFLRSPSRASGGVVPRSGRVEDLRPPTYPGGEK
jgi:hypothetical protein